MIKVNSKYWTRDKKRIVHITAQADGGNFYGKYKTESDEWLSNIWGAKGNFLGFASPIGQYDLGEEVGS